MTFKAFLAASQRIQRVRAAFTEVFKTDGARLSRAALRPILEWLEERPNATLADALKQFEDEFHLPAAQMRDIELHLSQAQKQVTRMRSTLFSELGIDARTVDVSSLQALYKVDFPSINHDVRNAVLRDLRSMIARGEELATFEAKLRQSGIIQHQARTLSQTALAQYDNSYTFELADEAGIDSYRYIGPPAQRPFCVDLLAKDRTFTRAEIEKMDNGQGLDVLSSGGGYNCQHQWIAVPEALLTQ